MNSVTAPEIQPISAPRFIYPEQYDSNQELYMLNAGSQEVVRIEVIFPAGTAMNENPTLAGMCNRMLREGTVKHNARQIADKLDFYGAYLESDTDADKATITLYVMSKFLPNVLPVFFELLTEPAFPEKELDIQKNSFKQQFMENQQKVASLSRMRFSEELFKNHPYGSSVNLRAYDELNVEKLRTFYSEYYKKELSFILASGKISKNENELIQRTFKGWSSVRQVNNQPFYQSASLGTIQVKKEDALQSGIRIGRTLPVKSGDDDLHLISLYNTLLGGYFGSRLMSNIRENKGFTYGIGSGVLAMERATMFVISTEVKGESTQETLVEINKELNKLCNEPVDNHELKTVINYTLGGFLRNTQGPFEQAERFKNIYFRGLDYTHYEKLFNKVNSVEASEIQRIAQTYFKPEMMLTAWAGK
ncbi:MAG: M16 family metallopeptidase [Flavobacteriales bacterium]